MDNSSENINLSKSFSLQINSMLVQALEGFVESSEITRTIRKSDILEQWYTQWFTLIIKYNEIKSLKQSIVQSNCKNAISSNTTTNSFYINILLSNDFLNSDYIKK